MRKIFHRRKEDPPFRIRCPEDIKLGMSDYPEATTEERCDFCLHMVKIPAYGVSKCPVCRNDIIPCSVCDANCKSCPYEQYGYDYGKTTQLTPQGKYWARLDLPYYPEGY